MMMFIISKGKNKMEINKYTKVKEINKNGCYYKKGTQIFFDDGSTNHELMCIATDTTNAKQIMTSLNVVDKIRQKYE